MSWLNGLTIFYIFMAWPCLAEVYQVNQVVQVSALDLVPTQVAVGGDNIDRMLEGWLKKGGYTATGFAEQIQKACESPLPVAIGPGLASPVQENGLKYILDGHHRASSVYRLLFGDYDQLPEAIKKVVGPEQIALWRDDPHFRLKVEVKAIYEDSASMITDFVKSQIGLVEREFSVSAEYQTAVKAIQSGNATSEQLQVVKEAYSRLPRALGELRDDPIRSAIGAVFYASGIDSRYFSNYVEFYFGDKYEEKLKAAGIVVTRENATSSEVVEKIRDIMFKDDELVSFLNSKTRFGFSEEAQLNWLAAVGRYMREKGDDYVHPRIKHQACFTIGVILLRYSKGISPYLK